jgi:hypothetical protein
LFNARGAFGLPQDLRGFRGIWLNPLTTILGNAASPVPLRHSLCVQFADNARHALPERRQSFCARYPRLEGTPPRKRRDKFPRGQAVDPRVGPKIDPALVPAMR